MIFFSIPFNPLCAFFSVSNNSFFVDVGVLNDDHKILRLTESIDDGNVFVNVSIKAFAGNSLLDKEYLDASYVGTIDYGYDDANIKRDISAFRG